jgi:hypothetical protein
MERKSDVHTVAIDTSRKDTFHERHTKKDIIEAIKEGTAKSVIPNATVMDTKSVITPTRGEDTKESVAVIRKDTSGTEDVGGTKQPELRINKLFPKGLSQISLFHT